MSKRSIENEQAPVVGREIKSGVFAALREKKRSILDSLSPIVWSIGCEVGDTGAGIDVRPVPTVVLANAGITRNRGTVGAIVEARTRDEGEERILALRESSRRVPVLVFCADQGLFDGCAPSFGVTSARGAMRSPAARAVVQTFLQSCEQRSRAQHELVDEFAVWRGLTGAEADLIYRLATGIRARDVHDAQGITLNTKKERIANIREKCWDMGIDEIVEIALNNAA